MPPVVVIMALLFMVLVTLIVNRIATVALVFTGSSKEVVRFQARSAFATVGFTSAESESVVNHLVRQRIIMLLMLLGNAGFVSTMGLVIATLTGKAEYPLASRISVLGFGLMGIQVVSVSPWVVDRMSRTIQWALRRFTRLEVHDYVNLLHLGSGYMVTEIVLEDDERLIGKQLSEARICRFGKPGLGHTPGG